MIGAITAGLYGAGVPPVFGSYESIATVALGASTTSVTFSSIPSTYKHLQIRASIKGATNDRYWDMRVGNGSVDSTASNYRTHWLQGNGSSASASTAANAMYAPLSGGGTNGSAWVMDILDYQNTNKNKTFRSLEGWDANGSGVISLVSGLWMGTSAINIITLSGGNLTATDGSIALYGIKG